MDPLRDVRLVDQAVHLHDDDELTWVVAGGCTVRVGDAQWSLDTRYALVIPGAVEHVVLPRPDSIVFPLMFPGGLGAVAVAGPRTIRRTPALESCARTLLQPGLAAEGAVSAARDAVRQLLSSHDDELPPLPLDERAGTVARAILERPDEQRSLEAWAARVHTSGKTLQRCFVRETGMTFPHWRAAVRLTRARELLERGETVAYAARNVGYATPSAFITAFRRRYGVTPGAISRRPARVG
jgi:AraC-like DNA-binding protein